METSVDLVAARRAQRRSNRLIGLTLGGIALVFFVGVFARIVLLGH